MENKIEKAKKWWMRKGPLTQIRLIMYYYSDTDPFRMLTDGETLHIYESETSETTFNESGVEAYEEKAFNPDAPTISEGETVEGVPTSLLNAKLFADKYLTKPESLNDLDALQTLELMTMFGKSQSKKLERLKEEKAELVKGFQDLLEIGCLPRDEKEAVIDLLSKHQP